MSQHTTSTQIIVAGATGDLGLRITSALLTRGAEVRALVRPGAPAAGHDQLRRLGATPVAVDPFDVDAMASAIEGASCVISALSGLREVIVNRQSVLLDATINAGVPRFMPSDYSADFSKTTPGHNRNFDLRREFMQRADSAPVQVTSILNGAFLDMLVSREMPIIQPRLHRVIHWGEADQPLDFTTKDDTAAYTAAAALDEGTPRLLRVAGATVSPRDIAHAVSQISGREYQTLRIGRVPSLDRLAHIARRVAPQPDQVFPAWQGVQYMRDMFSGDAQLHPLDNDRYPDLTLTSLGDCLQRSELAAPGHTPPTDTTPQPTTSTTER